MPKVTGPLFSLTAAGKLGDSICFQGGPSGTRAQLNPTHPDMATLAQGSHREFFLLAVASWNGLSGASKLYFEQLAEGQGMTGYNLYLKTFLTGGTLPGPTIYEFSGRPPTNDSDVAMKFSGAVWDMTPTPVANAVGRYSSTAYAMGAGMRWINVNIPQGATVTEAHITWKCYLSNALTIINTKIVGNLQPNAAVFSSTANYQARRGTSCGGANNDLRTVEEVLFDAIPAWTGGVEYQSPSLNTVIQEILDQGAWVSGNALALFWDDHDGRGTNSDDRRRLVEDHYGDPTSAPLLYIKAQVG